MWEALTAIGTIGSAIVIAATVIMAARQIRVTVDQLEQLRKSTQFEAARTVLLEMADPAFADAYRFVFRDLRERMKDESFRRELAQIGTSDVNVHKELLVLRTFDRIGTYVRFGLVDGETIYSTYAHRIMICYEMLRDVIAVHRQIGGGAPLYPNFEFLRDDCRRWLDAHGASVDLDEAMRRIADYEAQVAAQPAMAEGR